MGIISFWLNRESHKKVTFPIKSRVLTFYKFVYHLFFPFHFTKCTFVIFSYLLNMVDPANTQQGLSDQLTMALNLPNQHGKFESM